jgi:hypothetical protein
MTDTIYSLVPDEELARLLTEATEMELDSALRAVQSKDPDLGRRWAIGILEARDRHLARQERLNEQRRRIREYA